ncbi:Lrp/AsnC family transcriptional regulator [Bradyrhizobium sp. DASA03076]|uniref:Lrp/AsnC family transcriptional regulator n=1 Tax=Bradyrhizobium sp. BLXBL-03 TaxID=3395916 RepID=UPI003F70E8A6
MARPSPARGTELGRKIGLSQPTTSERLKRLEERGIIRAYRAVVDPASVGLNILKVIVPSPAELEGIVDAIARYGSVTTAIVLRSEPPKRIGRELIQRG